METLLGILPYIYFEEPVQLGDVTFLGYPDWQGRNHAPRTDSDRQCLQQLSTCFLTTRGLSTNKGAIKAMTYFLLSTQEGKEAETLEDARKAITLLRYALLRPDTQALDSVESTYMYAFALPPAGNDDYRRYQCWPNLSIEQEIWVSSAHQKFPLPGWYVDLQLVHTSWLEDIEAINQRFCGQRKLDQEDEVALAIDWYNQSFLKYTLRGIAGRLVDVATAFETLFQLPRHYKTVEFRKRIRGYLGTQEDSVLDNWAADFYSNVRSETLHKGKPLSYLFKHPEAQIPHVSFLWSSQRIFRECISAKTGLPRHIDNDRLTEELVPNEVHLGKLKKVGRFEKMLEGGLLEEVEELKPIHPAGKREDIIWLGKELLRGYKEQYKPNLPTLDLILGSANTSPDLGLKYYRFLEEFRQIYPNGYISVGHIEGSQEAVKKLKPITQVNTKQWQLESAIYNFARFAGWALLLPS